MREYHPLDVRHPSNRDLMRRHYLLDPPANLADPVPVVAPAPRAASGHREAPTAPWGRKPAQAREPATAPQTRRKSGGFLWNTALVAIFVIIFGSQNGWFDGLLDSLRLFARQNGVTLPF